MDNTIKTTTKTGRPITLKQSDLEYFLSLPMYSASLYHLVSEVLGEDVASFAVRVMEERQK